MRMIRTCVMALAVLSAGGVRAQSYPDVQRTSLHVPVLSDGPLMPE
ncbi:MAG TPA: hypothetical protein PKA59_06390 [Chakrabartia sp.]|nr:hypothetical protein [Chakrabartia sp.]